MQSCTHVFQSFLVMEDCKHRGIVFIDKDDRLPAGYAEKLLYHSGQTGAWVFVPCCYAILSFIKTELLIKHVLKFFNCAHLCGGKRET